MNAPHSPSSMLMLTQQQNSPPEQGGDTDLRDYWDIIVDSRWVVCAIAALSLVIGLAYVLLAKPVYESNLLIQVEDSSTSARGFLGETASLFDVKTPATAEIEIIRSRFVIGQAVDNTLFYVQARPRYLPVVGDWLARHAIDLSTPLAGWVTGTESISVAKFNVPQELEGSAFLLTAIGGGDYLLTQKHLDGSLKGHVGVPLVSHGVELTVSELKGKQGAEYRLVRNPRLKTIEDLQNQFKVAEKGRQSGVIEASLRDTSPIRLTRILNEISTQYVRQNVERKSAEAQKTLNFLEAQIPQFKTQLDQSEEAYNRYRNQQGTVALDEEAKLILNQSVDLQSKLLEAEQRRRDLISRFTPEHPAVRTLDAQINAWNREIAALSSKVRQLPRVQQDAVRLERDVKVANELYQQLRNNALQLQLVREGKVGNVRLIDSAPLPETPVQPRPELVIPIALFAGTFIGVIFVLARNTFFRGVRNPREIEAQTGLDVYGTIPLSAAQAFLAQSVAQKVRGLHLLASNAPDDPAIEALRSLSTALQFAMLETSNNRLVITGATPGVGKSFISANFAAVLASSGRRVLLIDADMRKGYLNQYFGLSRNGGLSEVVTGTLSASEAIHKSVIPNLDFLSTGVMPPNPSNLIMSGAFVSLLDALSAQYDLVIADTPPVLAASDTLGIAPHAGAVLMVVRAERTQIGEVHESIKRLAHAGKPVTGFLFNALDLNRRYYGNSGYKYGGYNYGYRYRNYDYAPQKPKVGS